MPRTSISAVRYGLPTIIILNIDRGVFGSGRGVTKKNIYKYICGSLARSGRQFQKIAHFPAPLPHSIGILFNHYVTNGVPLGAHYII